ncbi:MAG: type II toxin-antitoxin system Phd/YefM family antitoxin [Caldilineaceae bacterium]
MQIYTYSEARQKLVSLLDQALTEGDVLIRRRNGTLFLLRPEEMTSSPLDVMRRGRRFWRR